MSYIDFRWLCFLCLGERAGVGQGANSFQVPNNQVYKEISVTPLFHQTACFFRNSRSCSALYLHMMDDVGKHQLNK